MAKIIQKRKAKLLIVGCNKKFQERISSIFCTANNPSSNKVRFALFPKKTLEEALKAFYEEHPDLVAISDDFENGEELCTTIRGSEDARHTGIMVFESGSKGRSSIECLERGADDFISTSKSKREVLARAYAVIRLKVMTDELRHANHRLQVLSHTDEQRYT